MDALEQIVRREGTRVLATLTRRLGSLTLAEDAVQDAAIAALKSWPKTGVPQNPGAWLTTAAKNAALDHLRREGKRKGKEETWTELSGDLSNADSEPLSKEWHKRDDLLRLIFTCCHPALNPDAQVALSLRTLCGLTAEEIAGTFLVPKATMQQRIVRAKKKIASAKIPYRVPDAEELSERIQPVATVLYLLFTKGSESSNARVDLAEEALYLTRTLIEVIPNEAELHGLLALMLATHARRRARTIDGQLVLMGDQDRRLWDHQAIAEAYQTLTHAMTFKRPGPFQLQGAIACVHGLAKDAASTDWKEIANLYEALEAHLPTPVVRVNRAVAVEKSQGAAQALALLEATTGVHNWHLFHTTRAHMLVQTGEFEQARAAYRQALDCDPSRTDRNFIEGKLAKLEARAL